MSLVNEVNKWAREFGYRYLIIGETPSLVLIGEKHNREDHISAQSDLVRRLRPEGVLHEIAGVHEYNPNEKEWKLIKGVRIDRVDLEFHKNEDPQKDFQALADEIGFYIKGIDLSLTELDLLGIKSQVSRAGIESRERRMADRIIESYQQATKPLIAIVGKYHAKLKSTLNKTLSDNSIDYIIATKPD